jgi:hypothetical protein
VTVVTVRRPGVLAVLSGLAFGAGVALGAPQSGALRHDASRPTTGRSIVPVVHARIAPASDPREAARDARRAALGARLDALQASGVETLEVDDVEERQVVFDAAG